MGRGSLHRPPAISATKILASSKPRAARAKTSVRPSGERLGLYSLAAVETTPGATISTAPAGQKGAGPFAGAGEPAHDADAAARRSGTIGRSMGTRGRSRSGRGRNRERGEDKSRPAS